MYLTPSFLSYTIKPEIHVVHVVTKLSSVGKIHSIPIEKYKCEIGLLSRIYSFR